MVLVSRRQFILSNGWVRDAAPQQGRAFCLPPSHPTAPCSLLLWASFAEGVRAFACGSACTERDEHALRFDPEDGRRAPGPCGKHEIFLRSHQLRARTSLKKNPRPGVAFASFAASKLSGGILWTDGASGRVAQRPCNLKRHIPMARPDKNRMRTVPISATYVTL